MTIRNAILPALLVTMLLAGCSGGPLSESEQAAASGARKWLALVDEGKYAESWTEASSYFRGALPSEQWGNMAGAVRKPLGKTVSREVKSAKSTSSLPGAPDGQYVVIKFTTSFENKKSAVETVTPMIDTDGVWRVSGYFIR